MLCMPSTLDAIVFCDSAGRRLWGVIGDCPKAMTGIAALPFLELLLHQILRRV
jgi:hypothetical protein